MITKSNIVESKASDIHPLLETLLYEAFRYEADKGLNPQSAVRMALKIATEAERMLDAIGELHYAQLRSPELCSDPTEDTVQRSIQDAKSKLRMINELMLYASCSESDYAALTEYAKNRQKAEPPE
jgi:hypothetical protein